MKQLFAILLAVVIFSCNEKKSNPSPKAGESKIVAVYQTPDSIKHLDILLRIITKAAKYDSVKQKDYVSVDTIFGYPKYMPLVDSSGKQIIDSLTKKPKLNPFPTYFRVSKDSVFWQISGRDVDSLLMKTESFKNLYK
jgi:hypothetical protein